MGTIGVGTHPVEEDVSSRNPLPIEAVQEAIGLREVHVLGARDDRESTASRIAEHVANQRHVLAEAFEERIRRIGVDPTAEASFHVTVFLQRKIEEIDPALEGVGEFQESNRVSGRSGIEHDGVVVVRSQEIGQLQQGHHFVHAGEREIDQLPDLVFLEKRPASDDRLQLVAMFVAKGLESGGTVEFATRQIGRHFSPPVLDGIEDRVSRVGRHQEMGAVATLRDVEGGGRRTRRLAHASLATKDGEFGIGPEREPFGRLGRGLAHASSSTSSSDGSDASSASSGGAFVCRAPASPAPWSSFLASSSASS